MRVIRIAVLSIAGIVLAVYSFGQISKHVVLISIDGFRPDMYLDKSWPSPNLQILMKKGVYARRMKSVFPSYTYPSHTAMVTGALPARSGICYNQPEGSKGEWNWEAKYIKVPTLWQVLRKSAFTTAAVMWPGSVNADINFNISEIWQVNDPDDRITETRKYATPGLVEEFEKNATGKLVKENMSDGFLSLDENAGRMAAYIFKTYKPNLLCVHLAEVDGMEHEFGKDGDSVRLAVAASDRAIGDILEAIQRSSMRDSTTVIIVGDHGFCNINTLLRPNLLIRNQTVKFKTAGGSAFLYPLQDSNHLSSNNEIQRQDIVYTEEIKYVKSKLNSLPKEQKKLFRIIDRKELDKMGADSSALLALAAIPGVVFSGAVPSNSGPGTNIPQNNSNGFISPTKGGHHGYDPNISDMYTGFIIMGAGIRSDKVIEELTVTDLAPLIAELLGVNFSCPDGKLPVGLFK